MKKIRKIRILDLCLTPFSPFPSPPSLPYCPLFRPPRSGLHNAAIRDLKEALPHLDKNTSAAIRHVPWAINTPKMSLRMPADDYSLGRMAPYNVYYTI